MENILLQLNSNINELTAEYNKLLLDKTTLDNSNQFLQHENQNLKSRICEMEDAHKKFTSVSLIVAAKNENENLRNELELLKKRLKIYQDKCTYTNRDNTKSVMTETINTCINENNNIKNEYDMDNESDISCNVFETEIDNTVYFVTDDDDRYIYNRVFIDGDWEVGDEVGKLDDNNVPTWFMEKIVIS